MSETMLAEQPTQQNQNFDWNASESQFEGRPLVMLASEVETDQMSRMEAGHFIAQVAMKGEVELAQESRIKSLKEAIQLAAKGDVEALELLWANVASDVIERTLKAGHVIGAKLFVDADGNINQHGQTMDSVQANALKYASNHPAIRRRTEAEARNSFRLKHLYASGILEDYVMIVASRAADDMSEADMEKAGFFTDTMSTALQWTTVENGELVMESAFIAGVTGPGGKRHDQRAMVLLGDKLGVNLRGKNQTGLTATEQLDTPILIHKSLVRNGIVDVVEMIDDGLGGTFFGQNKLRQNYVAFRQKCLELEKTFEPQVEAIMRELIAEVNTIKTEIQAARRLNKISGKHMIDRAIVDETIDPAIFGKAADFIVEARHYVSTGDYEMMHHARQQAIAKDGSGSCPGDLETENEADGFGSDTDVYGFKKLDDCEFISKECPKCHEKNVKTKSTKDHTTGKVRYEGSCGCKS